MNRLLLRTTGAATAVYGIAVLWRPGLLARPSGLAGPGGIAPEVEVSLRPLGLRDAACGAVMALAPGDRCLRVATVLRIVADFGDAALLSRTLPTVWRRRAALVVSVGWGALSVAGLLGRQRSPCSGLRR